MDSTDLFNKSLQEFVSDLSCVYEGAEAGKGALGLAILLDRKMPHRVFKEHVVDPYGPQIKKRDEAFLMKQDFKKLTSSCGPAADDMDLVGQIKQVWAQLNPEEKETIWKHLEKLMKISVRVK